MRRLNLIVLSAFRGVLVLLLGLCFVGAGSAQGQASSDAQFTFDQKTLEGDVKLPLSQVLSLSVPKEKVAQPPVAAMLDKLIMQSRLLESGLDIEIEGQVSILTTSEWSRVAVLDMEGIRLTSLPELKDAYLAQEEGVLYFISNVKGRYTFKLTAYANSSNRGSLRSVRVKPADGLLVMMSVSFESGLFELVDTPTRDSTMGQVLLAQNGPYHLQWRIDEGFEAVTEMHKEAPEKAPSISMARASIVSTLNGRHLTRIKYRLEFEGRKEIDIVLPEGEELSRLYLNGRALQGEVNESKLTIEVAAQRSGDGFADLELVLERAHDGFYLSGEMDFELPSPSWNVWELYLEVHMPDAFNYAWKDGSLASSDEKLKAVSFSESMPKPGKYLQFHQYLMADSAPSVSLAYDVDLQNQYFCGTGS